MLKLPARKNANHGMRELKLIDAEVTICVCDVKIKKNSL